MMRYPRPILRLIDELGKLPGIGPKTAQRLAFHILKAPRADVLNLAETLIEARDKIRRCSICSNLTDEDPCAICSDPSRNRGIICVVEDPKDVMVMERTGEYNGVYHVLGGAISPMEGVGPEDLRLKELVDRVKKQGIEEVIIATNPDVEGEATAMYVARILSPFGVKVTRLARGVPVGGDLEYTDEATLARALLGRRRIDEQ
ncbi:MAG TPA: recombination protein RecR [Clostridia bacterium]|nr:recombination protein RecR [Clostridia bacterium]